MAAPTDGKHRRLVIRRTHPAFFHGVMTLALVEIALALNFWFYTPAFSPYGVPDHLVGAAFATIGTALLFFLNVWRDLRIVRLALSASVAWSFFWGIANTEQAFAGHTSFQLPILYVGLSVAHIWWLIEAPVNPWTKRS